MGAHTMPVARLERPRARRGLVVITPAYDPATNDDPARLARWDALARACGRAGVEGFLAAYGEPDVPPDMRETVLKVIRQRLALHEHPEAVADALQRGPALATVRGRSTSSLRSRSPVTVVASNDEPDPGHPQAIGEAYAAAIPGARLVPDEPGRSPVAWQGSQLSKMIAAVAAEAEMA